MLLPRRGTVIAWTTQGFAPGAPYAGPTGKDFVPFGVGLVQLGDVIRVEGRLTENDPAKLKFGQEVELAMIPFTTDAEGNEVARMIGDADWSSPAALSVVDQLRAK